MFGVYIKPRAQEFIFCLVFVAQEAILCIVHVILNSSSFSLKINNPSLFVNNVLMSGHTPILCLITDVTSDTTACIMAMQGQRIDGGFKTRLPRGLREMTLLGNTLYAYYQGWIKEPLKGIRISQHILSWGRGREGRGGKRKKIKGKEKVFMLAYIVSNYSHMSCECGGAELDPQGLRMRTSG